MSSANQRVIAAFMDLIEDSLAWLGRRPLVLGICGAQGSGKSTLAGALAKELVQRGMTCAVLSLDDLYLTKADREALSREVHPLLATRGPPGTHDVSLGTSVLEALISGTPARLPRFDKARDDRCDPSAWQEFEGTCDVVLFEGWCVGATAQPLASLRAPVNALEAREDPQEIWRRFVNDALAGPYQHLFSRIDRLALLQAPSFDIVFEWRMQQEAELRARRGEGEGVISEPQVRRFIMHYERLTRHILNEMPHRADLVVALDQEREPQRLSRLVPGRDRLVRTHLNISSE